MTDSNENVQLLVMEFCLPHKYYFVVFGSN